MLGAFSALAVVTLAIGIGFALVGAWLVLPFAGLEVAALAAAFVAHLRRVGKELETVRIGERRT
ncbi:MAG: DUF2244 domain-containing protein [Betaproteobacteria bacterium]|nr:DUF2244 domain-containing protein [Betaproteobacteria bacterium]